VGLFTALITLPLAPVRGAVWVAEKVAAEADRQLYDESHIRSELLQVEMACDEGRISEEERADLEEDLFGRLAIARRRAIEGDDHG
jgi:hypothetical protein